MAIGFEYIPDFHLKYHATNQAFNGGNPPLAVLNGEVRVQSTFTIFTKKSFSPATARNR